MDTGQLPQAIQAHLPQGYESDNGHWLVLPWDNGSEMSIVAVNRWLPAEPPYPQELEPVIWFGADGVGNWLGWDTAQSIAVLWNPYDESPWWRGAIEDLWQFILGGHGYET